MEKVTKHPHILLSQQQFYQFLAEVLELSSLTEGFFEGLLKVEEPLVKKVLPVDAIRIYAPEFKREINMTSERGECPKILFKKIRREKTGRIEYELVLLGSKEDRHVEELYAKGSLNWNTWGTLYWTPQQFKIAVAFFNRIVEVDEEPKKHNHQQATLSDK